MLKLTNFACFLDFPGEEIPDEKKKKIKENET